MKTGTSSLMDGKDYQQRNFVFSDDYSVDPNKMVDQVTDVEKLAEEHQQGGYEWQNEKRKSFIAGYNKAKETLYTKQDMIGLVQSLKDYTHESHTILGHDEREASEFVETFIDVFLLKNHMKQQEQ
jgi:hypothetical protein